MRAVLVLAALLVVAPDLAAEDGDQKSVLMLWSGRLDMVGNTEVDRTIRSRLTQQFGDLVKR